MLDAYSRRKRFEARLVANELLRGLGQALGGPGRDGEKWVDTDDLLARMGAGI